MYEWNEKIPLYVPDGGRRFNVWHNFFSMETIFVVYNEGVVFSF